MMYDSIEAYSDVADNYFGSFADDYYDAMADMYEEEGYCRFPEDFFEIEEYNIICTNYLHHKHHSGGERSRSVSNSGW